MNVANKLRFSDATSHMVDFHVTDASRKRLQIASDPVTYRRFR